MKAAVIATTTRYDDLNGVRTKLALETIKEAVKLGYKIVISDNSPHPVRKALIESGALVLDRTQNGMGYGKREAIKKAAAHAGPKGVIILMEPEKTPLISFLDELLEYFFDNEIELLIPARKSLSSYPKFQQYAERIGNRTFQMLTGKNLDVWFGPRIFLTTIAHYFLNYQGEYGDKWDSIFIPVIRAVKEERKIEGMPIGFIYPKEQMEEEKENLTMHMKRIEQLTTLTKALYEESKILGLI